MIKRVGFALGAQTSLSTTVQLIESVKKGKKSALSTSPSEGGSTSLSQQQIISHLWQYSKLIKVLQNEGVSIHWTSFSASSNFEITLLMKSLGLAFDEKRALSFSDFTKCDYSHIIYLPLDVEQNKQVEQLARLSMLSPKTTKVALSSIPTWDRSQLMALKETWTWLDPIQQSKLQTFAGDVIETVTGKTVEVDLDPENKAEFAPLIISRNESMKELLALVDTVADSDSTILLTGESGTGKELIARRIHSKSDRSKNKLVAINCAAIPSELLESELFGHTKGAFTGANYDRMGRFQLADGGSIFLDEIGDIHISLQVKLLRVLQEKSIEPVGSADTIKTDCRIIAATNKDLELEVAEGRFREDLFYRLNVIPVHLPPLRERKEDIESLVNHFIKKFNTEKSRRVTGITRAGVRSMAAYHWPGNIRELENFIERMVVLKSSGMIDVMDFPEKYRNMTLSEIEYMDIMNPKPKVVQTPQVVSSDATLSEQHQGQTRREGIMKEQNIFNQRPVQTTGEESSTAKTTVSGNYYGGGSTTVSQTAPQTDSPISIEEVLQFVDENFVFPEGGLDFNDIVDQFENILIMKALNRTKWNRNRASGMLKLNRTTLVEKLKKKQLMPPAEFAHKAPRTREI